VIDMTDQLQPRPRSQASISHFSQTVLADRWCISPRTLERWRWLKLGPAYIKVGGRVVYTLEDIEAYEARQRKMGA
jgi:hypothetical protein